jgi:hypothetical protein
LYPNDRWKLCNQGLSAQGWIDCKRDWESPELMNWDWSDGEPGCMVCTVQKFEADADGNVYVPPPKFGTSRCKPECELEFEQRMWGSDSGRQHCDMTTDAASGLRVSDHCREVYE